MQSTRCKGMFDADSERWQLRPKVVDCETTGTLHDNEREDAFAGARLWVNALPGIIRRSLLLQISAIKLAEPRGSRGFLRISGCRFSTSLQPFQHVPEHSGASLLRIAARLRPAERAVSFACGKDRVTQRLAPRATKIRVPRRLSGSTVFAFWINSFRGWLLKCRTEFAPIFILRH